MNLYSSFASARRALGETNDCAVIAVAAVTNSSYEYAHKVLAEVGRVPRKPTCGKDVLQAVNNLGYEYFQVSCMNPKTNSRLTPNTVGTRYTAGNYLCFVKGHVFAVIDGIVEDWTQGRKHRILSIYNIRRKVGGI